MRRTFFCLVLAVFLSSGAWATLVTDTSSFPAGAQVIDFSQFTGANQINGTNGPVSIIPGVVFTSENGAGYLTNYYDWGLGPNGDWTSARNGYAGVDDVESPIVFTFGSPVSAVGGFMSYQPGDGAVTIEALGSGSVVLESYDLTTAAPISTPTLNDGAFRGIVRTSKDIVAFRITGAVATIDDLTFDLVLVPVIPAASRAGLALLGLLLALGGVAALRLRG